MNGANSKRGANLKTRSREKQTACTMTRLEPNERKTEKKGQKKLNELRDAMNDSLFPRN